MNYRKINFLYVLRYLLLGILLFVSYYISSSLKEFHKTELNKNLKFEEKNITLNQLEKLDIKAVYRDKEEKFDDYLNYFFFAIIIGVSIMFFINRKIELENKKLDDLEGKENSA
jgi:hypothetical protein